ncbi:MAG: hypothetical protein IJN90_06185 [Bacilli bacterium]|nr:hypothetical protein [Bacilli bacterium]
MVNKKKNITILVVCIVSFWIISGFILYFSYMNRVERLFKPVKEAVLESEVLNKELGTIKKAKFNNFMQWISQKNNEKCIKMKITTKKGKENICVILYTDKIENESDLKVIGYYINDKRYEEENK